MSRKPERRRQPRLFSNDMRTLLFAYGDVQQPQLETIQALEDVMIVFMTDLCHEAMTYATYQGRKHKLKMEDFKFALRKDRLKLGRVEELMNKQKEIQEAQKLFDSNEKETKDDDIEKKRRKEAKRAIKEAKKLKLSKGD